MKCDVINLENKKVGSVDLSDAIFGVEVRSDILARVVDWQLAKRRAGTHSVKNLSTIYSLDKLPQAIDDSFENKIFKAYIRI